jgi:ketosteroid isomerase-like protein
MMRNAALLSLVLALLGCATADVVRDSRQTIADEEQLIRSLEAQGRRAILDRDVETLQTIWSPGLTVNAPNNQVVTGRDVVIALVQQGIIHYSSFESTIDTVFFGDGVAVVMGSETVNPIENAPLAGQTVQRRFTNIYEKDATGTWRLWARHANATDVR